MEKHYEWTVFTDGSRKGQDLVAHWGFILKQEGEERYRQRGKAIGSAQVGEVTAILESLLELEKRHIKVARIITDSRYCYQALKEDLKIWEENGFEWAKGKQVAHYELWTKISQLRHMLELDVVHQKAHTKEGEHWQGNREVDHYVQLRKVVFIEIEEWEDGPMGRIVPEKSVRLCWPSMRDWATPEPDQRGGSWRFTTYVSRRRGSAKLYKDV